MTHIYAIVVTYNRRALLEVCLTALSKQTLQPERIFVVDNASTDGTAVWLRHWMPANLPHGELITHSENLGGAGGFSSGLQRALLEAAGWVWMMDDDACPHPSALEKLIAVADNPRNIYGSLAVCAEQISWTITLLDEGRAVRLAKDVPEVARVESIPLLGFLIHSALVKEIGYPDASFFIAADDVEYCLRARRAGADIVVAGMSRIDHPRCQQDSVRILGTTIIYLSLPAWKRYYDTRNRLLVARKYHGFQLFTRALPGTFVRLAIALRRERDKLSQLRAFAAGIVDGLFGLKGTRHTRWGISQ